jgi:hypothetical protein
LIKSDFQFGEINFEGNFLIDNFNIIEAYCNEPKKKSLRNDQKGILDRISDVHDSGHVLSTL